MNQSVCLSAVSGHDVEPVRSGHEVRPRGARAAPALQEFGLHEPALQGQVAVHQLREGRAAVQGRRARVPRLVRALRYAVAQRER